MVWRIGQRGRQAWVAAPKVFSTAELNRICALWSNNKQQATVGGSGKVDQKVRNSVVQWVRPAPETEWLFDAVEAAVYQVNQHFGLELTEIQDLQLTEYNSKVEGHYGAHIDRDYGLPKTAQRKLSMTVQLSKPEDYDGGELLLYPANLTAVQIPRERGMTTFFRSDVIHEARPVKRGVRRSLVVWIAGPELR